MHPDDLMTLIAILLVLAAALYLIWTTVAYAPW